MLDWFSNSLVLYSTQLANELSRSWLFSVARTAQDRDEDG